MIDNSLHARPPEHVCVCAGPGGGGTTFVPIDPQGQMPLGNSNGNCRTTIFRTAKVLEIEFLCCSDHTLKTILCFNSSDISSYRMGRKLVDLYSFAGLVTACRWSVVEVRFLCRDA